MNQVKNNYGLIVNRVPIFGILCFEILYFYSSTIYPGGSQADINSEGFDWINNYWCNLMNEKGMNGELNPARPFSIFAMIVLCLSLIIFFFQFAEFFTDSGIWKKIIKFGGTVSMIFAILIFTKYHDSMTIVSSFFGLFVVIGIIKEIYKSELWYYKISGMICLGLLALNNFIYYTTQFYSMATANSENYFFDCAPMDTRIEL